LRPLYDQDTYGKLPTGTSPIKSPRKDAVKEPIEEIKETTSRSNSIEVAEKSSTTSEDTPSVGDEGKSAGGEITEEDLPETYYHG
jgi:hypothetical protein